MVTHTLTTIGLTAVGLSVAEHIGSNWLGGWAEGLLGTILKTLSLKLFVHTKRQYIIFIHSLRHNLPTPDHVKPLFLCDDAPCDILFKSDQDLGLAELGKVPVIT